MKIKALICLFLIQITSTRAQNAGVWEVQKVENGITVYSRDAENSSFKELKSVFQIQSSLASIVALLSDFESYPSWVYRCGKSSTLKKISETESYHYQTVVAPWPVDNRDVVIHVKLSQDPVTKVITQVGTSTPNYMKEVTGHVRIQVFKATWIISPLKNGMVNLEYQLMVDPGGNVPAWLVNLATVEGPYDTALAMKEWLMKDKYRKASIGYIKEAD